MTEILIITKSSTATANGRFHLYVETEDGKKICPVWGNDEDRLRHARLFAASPDLLEIAKSYLSLIQSDYEGRNGTMGSMQDTYDRTVRTIARAEGAGE